MHPILASPRKLALYLAAWLLLALPFAALLYEGGARQWPAIVGFSVAAAWTCALVCLGAWYSCWSAPLATTPPWRVVWVQARATLLSLLLWLGALAVLMILFDSLVGPPGATRRVREALPLLTGVGLLTFVLSVALHYLWTAYESSLAAQRRALELHVVAREAELKTLRAQIDPHFLFNSLHSISSLTTVDPAAARRMCVGLGDFLRATLRVGQQPFITLREELALIDGYLSIEQVRLGSRLTIARTADPEALPALVPPLLLHPLVENAITHGIGHMIDNGRLEIRVERLDRLRMAVNTGSLIEPEHVVVAGEAPVERRLHEHDPRSWARFLRIVITNSCDPERPRSSGTGVGLPNVQQRLATIYANEASLTSREREELFEVELLLPMRIAAADASPPASPRTTAEVNA